MYLAAFQSHLWNRLLATLLRESCRPEQLIAVHLKTGPVPFCVGAEEETCQLLRSTSLPLPSSRMHLDEGPIKELVDRSLAELGLTLREIRVKYPRDSFFSKGWRPVCFSVAGLSHESEADDLYRGQKKLTMSFDLPRGSYATILVKRVTTAVGQPTENLAEDVADHAYQETETSA